MRAKKILLLSCLYPLLLFFVIGYTNSYTLKKVFVNTQNQSEAINLSNVSFITPLPTIIVLPEKMMDGVTAYPEKPKEEKNVPSTKASPSAKPAQTIAAKISTPSAVLDEASQAARPTQQVKDIASQNSNEEIVQAQVTQGSIPSAKNTSVSIDEKGQSSVIIPSSSTYIVSPDTQINDPANEDSVQVQP